MQHVLKNENLQNVVNDYHKVLIFIKYLFYHVVDQEMMKQTIPWHKWNEWIMDNDFLLEWIWYWNVLWKLSKFTVLPGDGQGEVLPKWSVFMLL